MITGTGSPDAFETVVESRSSADVRSSFRAPAKPSKGKNCAFLLRAKTELFRSIRLEEDRGVGLSGSGNERRRQHALAQFLRRSARSGMRERRRFPADQWKVDSHKLIWIGKGQRAKQQPVHHREESCRDGHCHRYCRDDGT
jgi:hypothetical protein